MVQSIILKISDKSRIWRQRIQVARSLARYEEDTGCNGELLNENNNSISYFLSRWSSFWLLLSGLQEPLLTEVVTDTVILIEDGHTPHQTSSTTSCLSRGRRWLEDWLALVSLPSSIRTENKSKSTFVTTCLQKIQYKVSHCNDGPAPVILPPHPPTSSHSSRGVPTTNRGVLWLTLQIRIDSDFLLFK